jgi:aldose 1-epimerase
MEWGATMHDEVDGFETPINLCNHAYWNLSGDFSEPTIGDHFLQVKSDKVFRFNEF